MHNYEEYHEWSKFKSWAFIILLSAFLIAFVMSLMFLIPPVPRQWEYGTVDYTPGKSIYSTNEPDDEAKHKVIEPLPESVPLEKKSEDK